MERKEISRPRVPVDLWGLRDTGKVLRIQEQGLRELAEKVSVGFWAGYREELKKMAADVCDDEEEEQRLLDRVDSYCLGYCRALDDMVDELVKVIDGGGV